VEEMFWRSEVRKREESENWEQVKSLVVRRVEEDEDVKSSMRMRKVKGRGGIEHEHACTDV
jgi:hypothetical protein